MCLTPMAKGEEPALFYTKGQKEVYFLLWDLKFEQANALLAQESQRYPSHPANWVLKSLGLTFLLLLEGDNLHYYQAKEKENQWLDSVSLGKKDAKHAYAKALIKLHWGLLKTVYGEGLSGALAMRQVFLQLKQHKKGQSSPHDNVYYAAFEVALSNIPEQYQWAAQLVGLQQDEKEGWSILERTRHDHDEVVTFEAKLFSLLLKNYLQYPREEIIASCSELSAAYPQKGVQLVCIWLFDKCNASGKAKELLPRLEEKGQYPYFHYIKGLTAYQLLEKENAKNEFLKYVGQSKSVHYKKDALYRLSLLYGLEGDSIKSEKYKERVKKQGSSFYYADKQALKMAYKQNPASALLLAKMAYEGGLFSVSLDHLATFSPKELRIQVETYYLKAKNYQGMGNEEEAKRYYRNAIQACPREGLYYGPMACWYLAKEAKKKGDLGLMNRYLDTLGLFKNYEHRKDIQEKVVKLKRE